MHDILSNRCRRAILYYLQEQDEPVTIEVLVRQLARWKSGRTIPEPATGTETLANSDVCRSHIRKMADFDIVGYDSDSETVWIRDGVVISVAPPWQSIGDLPARNRLANPIAPANRGFSRKGDITDPGPE
ncbi:MAG: DUF7344 domain-containing protein [Halodesulfurarchaeum sp.]